MFEGLLIAIIMVLIYIKRPRRPKLILVDKAALYADWKTRLEAEAKFKYQPNFSLYKPDSASNVIPISRAKRKAKVIVLPRRPS